ncbi:hypothetical protein D3C71_1954660 [compost metagenome]
MAIIFSIIFVAGIALTVPTLISIIGQLGGTSRGTAVTLYTFILFIGATLGPIGAALLLQLGSIPFAFLLLSAAPALSYGIALVIQKNEAAVLRQ